jgi:hypothetical protein
MQQRARKHQSRFLVGFPGKTLYCRNVVLRASPDQHVAFNHGGGAAGAGPTLGRREQGRGRCAWGSGHKSLLVLFFRKEQESSFSEEKEAKTFISGASFSAIRDLAGKLLQISIFKD